MMNDNRVGNVSSSEYSEKLKSLLSTYGDNTPADAWVKLSDYTKKLSSDQLIFISKNKKVAETKQLMMEGFTLWFFEKNKSDYYRSGDAFQKLCDDYISAVINAKSEYDDNMINAFDENEKLKAKIAELERKVKANEKQSKTN